MRHQRFSRNLVHKQNRLPSNKNLGSYGSRFRRGDLAICGFLLLLLLSAAAYARADDQIRAVRLSNVVGSVQILSGTETEFSQAYPNMPLMQGSTLKTGEDGRAEIQLEDGSVVRMTPNSSVAMTVLARDPAGKTKTEVDLLTGLTYVEMKGTANQLFVVHFNGNEVISPAPVTFRVSLDASPVEFAVLDGSAHLSKGTDYAVDVHMNETVRFDQGDTARYLLAQGIDADTWDQWNVDRDQVTSQMAAQETREAVGSGNAGAAGMSDLNYYGNWYASNDGSSFWVPDGAGAGWDPYGSGYWGYYGQTGGYVWISGYPWGWLPYRCGTWNYFNSFNGWGWSPGAGCWNGNNWYGGGVIGNVPPRYHRLPRPNPVHPVQPVNGPHPLKSQALITVNRGPEASTLLPRPQGAPKTIPVNEGTARLMPKSPTSQALTYNRPGMPTYGSPAPGRTASGFTGGQQVGNVPVFRPTAPVVGNRPAVPSFDSHYGGSASRSSFSSAPPSASRSSFSSAAPSSGGFHGSAPSAAPSAPAPSAGGGHPH